MDLQKTLLRLESLCSKGIARLEGDTGHDGKTPDAAGRERDARTLRILIKAVEDIAALKARLEQAGKEGDDQARQFTAERRNELARRIEALSKANR